MDTENMPVVEKLSLVESKLYALNREQEYLTFLVPDIQVQMSVEEEIDQAYPRTDKDGDDTRIFIYYTNAKGNSIPYQINDPLRLAREFGIDEFTSGFFAAVNEGNDLANQLEILQPSIVQAIVTSVINSLELADEKVLPKSKEMSKIVFQSLISIILNDPLDAIVLIKENEKRPDQSENPVNILGMWTIHSRD